VDDVRGVVPPKQQRSKMAVERILRAAEELVEQRNFHDLTVQELCIAAEVSPSSFYARFPAKEDVLIALFDLHSREARDDATVAILEVAERSGNEEDMVRALLAAYLRFVRRNGPVMVSIFAEPSLTDRYWSLSSEIYDELEDVLGGIFGASGNEFVLRSEFATRVAAAALQRAVGLPTRFSERMGMNDTELVDELTAMVTPYLQTAANISRDGIDRSNSE
jgi:AcrR family transcriptional regulator